MTRALRIWPLLTGARALYALAHAQDAELWPDHDFAFFNRQAAFPRWRE